MGTLRPVSPGEMFDAVLQKPLGLTNDRLPKDIGVPPRRIGDIVAGKRAITADTDLRLCCCFGLSGDWWLRGQANHDTAIARETMGDALARSDDTRSHRATACISACTSASTRIGLVT